MVSTSQVEIDLASLGLYSSLHINTEHRPPYPTSHTYYSIISDSECMPIVLYLSDINIIVSRLVVFPSNLTFKLWHEWRQKSNSSWLQLVTVFYFYDFFVTISVDSFWERSDGHILLDSATRACRCIKFFTQIIFEMSAPSTVRWLLRRPITFTRCGHVTLPYLLITRWR